MKSQLVILITDDAVVAERFGGNGRQTQSGWQSRTPCDVPSTPYGAFDPQAIVEAAAAAIHQHGVGNATATLVIPSGWCYVHKLQLPGSRFSEKAATYALEEFLPVAIDTVVCDFQRNDDNAVVGIAVPTEPMQRLIATFESNGVEIDAIIPGCALVTGGGHMPAEKTGIIIRDAMSHTLVMSHKGGLPLTCIKRVPVLAGSETAEIIEAARKSIGASGVTMGTLDLSNDTECSRLLRHVVAGTRFVNLCTGALAGRHRRHAVARQLEKTLALAAMLMVCLLAWRFTQGRQYHDALTVVQNDISSTYHSVFPDATVPRNPAMRLASERLRLERQVGTTDGVEIGGGRPPDRLATLAALRAFAESLPSDIRLRLQDVTIDERRFVLRGETRNHRDAERIVEIVSHIDGWHADPPRTSRVDDGGVQFSLRATRDDTSASTEALVHAK